MSEPDRLDAKARELVQRVDGMTYGHSDDERAAVVAAALRAAESSALERAARITRRYSHHAEREIRALIPPAAENAAERQTCVPCQGTGRRQGGGGWGRCPDCNGVGFVDAAPAAVTIHPPTSCAPSATIPPPSTATLEDAGISQPTYAAAPAGDLLGRVAPAPPPGPGTLDVLRAYGAPPAAETRCPFDEQDCLDARQLLRECEEALSTVGCHPDGEALAQAVLRKLAARAAPPKETT